MCGSSLYDTSDAHKAVAEALEYMWEEELGVKATLNNSGDGRHSFRHVRMEITRIARNGFGSLDFSDRPDFLP